MTFVVSHSFSISFQSNGSISELEANEKITRIKSVCLQRKDGEWSMPIFNHIQHRGGQEAASGLPGGCKSLKCSSSAQYRRFLL